MKYDLNKLGILFFLGESSLGFLEKFFYCKNLGFFIKLYLVSFC